LLKLKATVAALTPHPVDVAHASAGKTIALFALPGAFTPTCSAKHVPGYVAQYDSLKAAGVDEIWCFSVSDAFVMGAWGRELKSTGKVRMMGDGSADFTKATGLTLDLTARGMGLRSNRYSMLVKDGKVATLNIEGPGKFGVSDADTLLAAAKAYFKTTTYPAPVGRLLSELPAKIVSPWHGVVIVGWNFFKA